jgi:hypothetical protein
VAFLAGSGRSPSKGIDLDDLSDAVGMMVKAGRVPPASRWVESEIERAKADEIDGAF